ncbi:LuxR family two component transcriptional regulator [Panacagrimonas perspica]|uniref:LuxR family two component transcriptional regulator n=1 Tax=Panacagrimonas perspica TaxID=381431 RepID=A0A4V3F4N0_9GAMM|nr:response regulator transcription factor [Panacagrimonas perspica]TDU25826.1 LuxR family two component transcriptional regulator [Panacagrimonas perspica]THD02806.1 DNA-binding response regulator [Panacagrimonas perspica]
MKYGLVVEDQPSLAQWLGETLRESFTGIEITVTATLAEARRALQARRPEIALIDLGLPDGNGTDLIREICASGPACHCVVTTIYADDRHLFPALTAGASGYLLKDQPRERTIAALRGIAAGEPPLSAEIARRLLRLFAADGPSASGAPAQHLTTRESETLALIAKGYKIAEVATSLGITRNTAHGFIKSIYRKLNISNRAQAAVEATRRGLINPHL